MAVAVLAGFVTSAAPSTALTASAIGSPDCAAGALSLRAVGQHGAFDGVGHSETLLVVRNASERTCRLQPFPHIVMEDVDGQPIMLAIKTRTAFSGPIVDGRTLSLGHGPVAFPIAIAPGGTLEAELRWVDPGINDAGACVVTQYVGIKIGAETLRTPLTAHLCGPAADRIGVTTTPLRASPK